jgi:hypothetical protein
MQSLGRVRAPLAYPRPLATQDVSDVWSRADLTKPPIVKKEAD